MIIPVKLTPSRFTPAVLVGSATSKKFWFLGMIPVQRRVENTTAPILESITSEIADYNSVVNMLPVKTIVFNNQFSKLYESVSDHIFWGVHEFTFNRHPNALLFGTNTIRQSIIDGLLKNEKS